METTLNRSVDVGPTRTHPGLAFLFALLSVPGTTMVWDLDVPVPGFWIGGPIGVAAIVLARRALRELTGKGSRRMAIAAIVIATLALGQMIIWTAVSVAKGQSPTTRTLTFTELDKGSTFKHVRNTKTKQQRSALLGDLFAFTNPLADASGKVIGKLHVWCVATTGSSNFLKSKLSCSGEMVLSGGTLTFQAITSPGVPTTQGAITGGTGVYANARGVFVSVENKQDVITLVP